MAYKVGIITLSDKGSRGEREDLSGPAIRELLEQQLDQEGMPKYEIESEVLLPDDQICWRGHSAAWRMKRGWT